MMLKASEPAIAVAVIGPLALALTSESFGALVLSNAAALKAVAPATNNRRVMEFKMSTQSTFVSAARHPGRARFVIVNDRLLGTDAYCVLCCEKIRQNYVRDPQTHLLYCDARCFVGHEKMTTLAIKRRARQVS
jgi:hypothetical protein